MKEEGVELLLSIPAFRILGKEGLEIDSIVLQYPGEWEVTLLPASMKLEGGRVEVTGPSFDYIAFFPVVHPNGNQCVHGIIGQRYHFYVHQGMWKEGDISVVVVDQDHSAVGYMEMRTLAIRLYAPPRPLTPYTFDASSFYLLGHRGGGAEDATSRAVFQENTVSSYSYAGIRGKQGVEFDVQLSKDLVPVIYHDFLLQLPENALDIQRIPVHDLPYEHFKRLGDPLPKHRRRSYSFDGVRKDIGVEAVVGKGTCSIANSDDVIKERGEGGYIREMYPTLEQLCHHLPPCLSFDVEIKYPIGNEIDLFHLTLPSRQVILEKALEVLYRYHDQQRPIFFSSFDPDCCVYLKRMQSIYPVFFITKCLPHYKDERCRSLASAMHFAAANQLTGLVIKTSVLLQELDMIDRIHALGLVVSTYGEDNNQPQVVSQQRQRGVDFIISDAILPLDPMLN